MAAATSLLLTPTAQGASGEGRVVELVQPVTESKPTSPAVGLRRPEGGRSETHQIARLLAEFRLAAQEQDLATIDRLLSRRLTPAEREKQLSRVRESLWLPMYRLYGLRVDEALAEIDPKDLEEGGLHLRITVDTPAGEREHDDFWLRREAEPQGPPRWVFFRLKLERPKKGEYLILPMASAEQVLTTVERFTEALDAGDADAALALASPRLTEKKRRELADEIEDRFLRRYLYRQNLRRGSPAREPGEARPLSAVRPGTCSQPCSEGPARGWRQAGLSVRYMLVVSHEEAPGSIFRYYDHGEIAVPFNLHYLEPHRFGLEEKVKKYALVFRWEEPQEAGRGRWELVDTTRRDKGFWRGVGRAFAAFGKGTAEVTVGVLGDLPALVPSYVRIGIRH